MTTKMVTISVETAANTGPNVEIERCRRFPTTGSIAGTGRMIVGAWRRTRRYPLGHPLVTAAAPTVAPALSFGVIVGGPMPASGYACAPTVWAAALFLGLPPYFILFIFISFIFMYISSYTACSSTSECITKNLARTDGGKLEKLSSLFLMVKSHMITHLTQRLDSPG